MEKSASNCARNRTRHAPFALFFFGGDVKSVLFLLLASLMVLSACGGSSSSSQSQNSGPLSGNWQFAITTDNSFQGGLQSGFLLQNKSAVSGQVAYSITVPSKPGYCNSGSATVTGTVNGQNVMLM